MLSNSAITLSVTVSVMCAVMIKKVQPLSVLSFYVSGQINSNVVCFLAVTKNGTLAEQQHRVYTLCHLSDRNEAKIQKQLY